MSAQDSTPRPDWQPPEPATPPLPQSEPLPGPIPPPPEPAAAPPGTTPPVGSTPPPPGPAAPLPYTYGQLQYPYGPSQQYGQPQYSPGQPQYPYGPPQQYGQPHYRYGPGQPYPYVNPPREQDGLGIAALVIGVIVVMTCYIPIINVFALVMALAGIGLGIGSLRRTKRSGQPRGLAVAGLILSVTGLVVGVAIDAASLIWAASGDGSGQTFDEYPYDDSYEFDDATWVPNGGF